MHGSKVGSVISATKSAASGAAKVNLFMYNRDNPRTTTGHMASFAWLYDQDVLTVNESHQNGDPLASDYWAWVFDVTSVKAAGNDPDEPAHCAANDICVGATWQKVNPYNMTMACYSSYKNDPTLTDKEEPDVVAFGGARDALCELPYFGAQVHEFGSTSDWTGEESSTSYAAASVTSMVAHVRNECASLGIMEPELLRALFRAAAWENPHSEDYSTPSLGYDYRDGGGWIGADALDWFCSGTGSGGVMATIQGQLSNSDPAPQGTTTYTPGDPHGVSYPLNYTEAENMTRHWKLIASATLVENDRARFSLSWDSCPLDIPPVVGVDFDLFLFNKTTSEFVYGSQSLDDNNEGFHVRIDKDGVHEVWVGWPANDPDNCSGTEDYEFAVVGRWGSPW
jgi:hypothetical protein